MPSLSEEALTNSKELKRRVMARLNLLKDNGISIAEVCKIAGCHPRIVLAQWIGATMRNNPNNVMTERHYIKLLNTIGIKVTVAFSELPDSKIEELITKINEQKERITTGTK